MNLTLKNDIENLDVQEDLNGQEDFAWFRRRRRGRIHGRRRFI